MQKVAIQGELGSNSHMAALAVLSPSQETGIGRPEIEIVACAASADVFDRVAAGDVDGAILPIENSLHGSVAEHYDLLLDRPVAIARESLLRVRHNLIAHPGTRLEQIRRVLSHPVALSQCRRWLRQHPQIEVVPFYDTAGSVKHLMTEGLADSAGIAPVLAAQHYGAEVLIPGIEDHPENFTRFHLLLERSRWRPDPDANKSSVAFSVAHRPGTLVLALQEFAGAGVNLTKIESRPVPGTPWKYSFFADLRFDSSNQIDRALDGLARHSHRLKELGRYVAA